MKRHSLSGAVVLITGGSRGIGRATAQAFAEAGARVAICARSKRELAGAAAALRKLGADVLAREADLHSPAQMAALVRAVIRRFGRLDVLINNAGILGPRVPILGYPLTQWRRVLDINLTGTFAITQAAAGVMSGRRGGCIITISSSVGRAGRAQWGAYAVSKFGVEGLTQVLADELRDRGVCVITFNPGGTRTRMRAAAYPTEDPRTVKDPALPAAAIVRLAAMADMQMTGRAFDMDSVPKSS